MTAIAEIFRSTSSCGALLWAGGLSLGLEKAGFRNVLAVDKLQDSVETHACHFPGASINCDISDEKTLEELLEPLRKHQISLLAGGPPCQPFSKPLRWARKKGEMELGSMKDHRRELWQSFVHGVKLLKPLSVLLENVTDIATNEDGIILRKIIESLENLGYSCDVQAFHAFDFGVAQTRQRLFLVAVHNKYHSSGLQKHKHKSTLRDAISDLPELEGGWDEKHSEYQGPVTELQKRLRTGMPEEENKLFDHVTRRVREDDLDAFKLLKAGQKYSELPEENRRYSIKSFTDKYNRLKWDEPCRTITAMSRDGYWYIHPEQNRTLSIREAARIQSFPDWFRFAGFRSSAFYQIGEAVAPFVAEEIGKTSFNAR